MAAHQTIPIPQEKTEKPPRGIRGVLLGPPGSGKGTQVIQKFFWHDLTMDWKWAIIHPWKA